MNARLNERRKDVLIECNKAGMVRKSLDTEPGVRQ